MRSRWTAAGRSRFKSALHDHFAVLHHAAPLHKDVGKLKLITEDQQIGAGPYYMIRMFPWNNLSFYGSLTRANGSDYQEDYHYSVGARYVF